MSAVVQDRTSVYRLGGGSGFLTSFCAWCAECRWGGAVFYSGGGGSPTPCVSDQEARECAQGNADEHNAERHEEGA